MLTLRSLLAPLLLLALTLALFWPASRFSFVDWDDNIHIYNNPHLQQSGAPDVAAFWKAPYIGLYIPVTFTAWSAITPFARDSGSTPAAPSSEYTFQFNPRPFHLANLFTHALNALLVFAILQLLFANAWASLAGAALFALHPNQVEAVAWATALKDLLGGFFSFLTLWLYLLFARARAQKQSRAKLFFVGATIAFLLALLSKPSAVALPLVAAWLDYWLIAARPEYSDEPEYSDRARLRRVLHPVWLWLFPAIALAGAMRLFIQKVEKPELLFPAWQRLFVAGDALAFYLAKIVWPAEFVIVYGRRPDVVLGHWWGYATWLLPATLLAIAWALRTRAPYFIAALGVFILSLLPTSGLVPFIFQTYSTVADRYLYPALLGAAILLAGALREYSARGTRRFAYGIPAVCALWLVAVSVQTRVQLMQWRSDRALWTDLLRYDPNSWFAHNNLGGIDLEAGQIPSALAHLEQANRMRPGEAQVLTNLGDAYAALGKNNRAAEYYREAMRAEPKYLKAPIQLATLLQKTGKILEAMEGYRAVLREAPNSVSANYNLGLLLAGREDYQNAIAHYETALGTRPDDPQIHDALATALARSGQMEEAETHWRRAVELDQKFVAARINLGVLLAMQNRIGEAIPFWQQAVTLEPKNAQAHFYLGQAFAATKQNALAKEHLQTALKLQPGLDAARKLLHDLR
jgi:tetratricopeptide (TPR) repeat protein